MTSYFRDDVAATRHRVVGIAVAARRAVHSCTRLSRRNARVWEVQWADGADPVIVKLACGRSIPETTQAAAALSREVQVVCALHHAGLVLHRIVDYGRERGISQATWLMTDRVAGCRASALLRHAVHSDADALDVCVRAVRRVVRQHRADTTVLSGIDPADDSVLDRPVYGPLSPSAAPVVGALRRLREGAPRLVVCHGDLSMHNVLVSASEVSFVDWAGARIDLPSLDLSPILVWLAHHTLDHDASLRLVRIARQEYGDHTPDPFLGLPQHVARVLLQWSTWRGPEYSAAAGRVLHAANVEELVRVLAHELDGIRKAAEPAA